MWRAVAVQHFDAQKLYMMVWMWLIVPELARVWRESAGFLVDRQSYIRKKVSGKFSVGVIGIDFPAIGVDELVTGNNSFLLCLCGART